MNKHLLLSTVLFLVFTVIKVEASSITTQQGTFYGTLDYGGDQDNFIVNLTEGEGVEMTIKLSLSRSNLYSSGGASLYFMVGALPDINPYSDACGIELNNNSNYITANYTMYVPKYASIDILLTTGEDIIGEYEVTFSPITATSISTNWPAWLFDANSDFWHVGTRSSYYFNYLEEGKLAMSVKKDGKLGIGMQPVNQLDVSGASVFSVNTNSDSYLKFGSLTSSSNIASLESKGSAQVVIDQSASHIDDRTFDIRKDASNGPILVRVEEGGNVGVGTNNPQDKLHVKGNVRIENGNITIRDNGLVAPESTPPLKVATAYDDRYLGLSKNMISAFRGASYSDLLLNHQSSANTLIQCQSSGRVGIGTVNPETKLHVWGGTYLGGNTSIGKRAYRHIDFMANTLTSYNGDDYEHLLINVPGDPTVEGFVGIGTTLPEVKLHVKGNGKFEGDLSSTGQMSTNDLVVDGKIGVGTLTPDAKLHVQGVTKLEGDVYNTGVFRTTEVIIEVANESTWPDYVFRSDYNLLDLYEVEKHIEEQGHLPSIPSAKAVEEEGVSVGEMNKLLLQKVEELTLYMIELKKQNDKLSCEIEALKINR